MNFNKNITLLKEKRGNLQIIGFDVGPNAHETAQTGNLRLAHEFSERGWKIDEVNQVGKLLRVVSDGFLHALREHFCFESLKFNG